MGLRLISSSVLMASPAKDAPLQESPPLSSAKPPAAAAAASVTPVQVAGAIVELLVHRGVRPIHVDEETATRNAQTNEVIEPPLLSGRDLALGKRRWWAATHKLTDRVMIPSEIANRRNALFYWSYNVDEKTKELDLTTMRFLVRDPPRPTNADLSDEISRRFNILQETTLPAVHKKLEKQEKRVAALEEMWMRAPELVYRPDTDEIVMCTKNRLNAPVEPPLRELEEKARDKLEEEKLKLYEEKLRQSQEMNGELRILNVRLTEYIKKVDVRLAILEGKVDDQKKLWESMVHLQEQMKKVFERLGIKTLDKKPPAQPRQGANGKLPVKEKAKESPV